VIGALLGADEFGFANRAPDRGRLHHDAQVPSQQPAPVGRRDAGPGVAQALQPASPEARHQLLLFCRRGKCAKIMAQLGYRTFNEMIGQTPDCSTSRRWWAHWKAEGLDFSKLFRAAEKRCPGPEDLSRREAGTIIWKPCLDRRLDRKRRGPANRPRPRPVKIRGKEINNTDRSARARCCRGRSRKIYGNAGLAAMTLFRSALKGTAGQAFGRRGLAPAGVTFGTRRAKATTMSGKGLSGGPHHRQSRRRNSGNRAGKSRSSSANTVMYGARPMANAISAAIAGEPLRGAVTPARSARSSRGAGDHCCEYMTGGHRRGAGQDRAQLRGRAMSGGPSPTCWMKPGGLSAKLCPYGDGRARTGGSSEEDDQREHLSPQPADLEAHGRVGRGFKGPARIRRRAATRIDHAVTGPSWSGLGKKGRPRILAKLEDVAAEIPQGDAGGIPPRP